MSTALFLENSSTEALHMVDSRRLRAEFDRVRDITEQALVYLSTIWSILVERGEDVSGLTSGIFRFLPEIASNRLSPALAVKLGNSPRAISIVAGLSREEQQRILANPIDVVVKRDGKLVTERAMVTDVSVSRLRSIVRDGRILSAKQQELLASSGPVAEPMRQVSGLVTDRVYSKCYSAAVKLGIGLREFVALACSEKASAVLSDSKMRKPKRSAA